LLKIVGIRSDAGTTGHGSPSTAAYGAAKAGLAHLVKSVACEYGKDGIRMTMVSPGATETGPHLRAAHRNRYRNEFDDPLHHRGKPEDIANAVVFFASDLSMYVTGQILGVDGGVRASRARCRTCHCGHPLQLPACLLGIDLKALGALLEALRATRFADVNVRVDSQVAR
jgi:hypothetical protein